MKNYHEEDPRGRLRVPASERIRALQPTGSYLSDYDQLFGIYASWGYHRLFGLQSAGQDIVGFNAEVVKELKRSSVWAATFDTEDNSKYFVLPSRATLYFDPTQQILQQPTYLLGFFDTEQEKALHTAINLIYAVREIREPKQLGSTITVSEITRMQLFLTPHSIGIVIPNMDSHPVARKKPVFMSRHTGTVDQPEFPIKRDGNKTVLSIPHAQIDVIVPFIYSTNEVVSIGIVSDLLKEV